MSAEELMLIVSKARKVQELQRARARVKQLQLAFATGNGSIACRQCGSSRSQRGVSDSWTGTRHGRCYASCDLICRPWRISRLPPDCVQRT
jgi:hypothetical protein